MGDTLRAAAAVYPECMSSEIDSERYFRAIHQFQSFPNVRIYHGNSPDILRHVIDPEVSTVFWLDAHFIMFSDGTPENPLASSVWGQCPILEELRVIHACPWKIKPVVLIDDFVSFERRLHRWPTIEDLDRVMTGWRREPIDSEVFSYHVDTG